MTILIRMLQLDFLCGGRGNREITPLAQGGADASGKLLLTLTRSVPSMIPCQGRGFSLERSPRPRTRTHAHATSAQIHRLQVVQNRFHRKALGAPWYLQNERLHLDLRIPTIKQFSKHLSKSNFESADKHYNPLIVSAVRYVPSRISKVRRDTP